MNIQNTRNNALNSNIYFGSTIFTKDVTYQVQLVELPGVSVNHPELSTNVGNVFLQGDMIDYSSVKLSILVDEELYVWREIIGIMQTYHKPGTNLCELISGDSWIELRDNRNNYLFKLELKNSYIKSVGTLGYTTAGDNEIITLDVELVYDYFEVIV